MLKQVEGRRKIRVWDAGCAMGQEVYTLAIVLAERMGYFAFQNLEIVATDIEEDFEKIVTKAEYPAAELARIPANLREKYFEPGEKDGYLRVIDKLKSRITFIHNNLLDLVPVCSGASLIVCKNVLLHLQPKERIEVFKMFHQSLDKSCILANENTQKLPSELKNHFELLCPDAQVYRKQEITR